MAGGGGRPARAEQAALAVAALSDGQLEACLWTTVREFRRGKTASFHAPHSAHAKGLQDAGVTPSPEACFALVHTATRAIDYLNMRGWAGVAKANKTKLVRAAYACYACQCHDGFPGLMLAVIFFLPFATLKFLGLLEAHHASYRVMNRLLAPWAVRYVDKTNKAGPSVWAKVKRTKKLTAQGRNRLAERPRMCVVVTSFNQGWNVAQLATRLTTYPSVDELIVCEDGSIDGSTESWLRSLGHNQNFFLLRSNDLHELRTLTRAVAMSRSDVFCIVQDDDVLPEDDAWLTKALALFDRHPKLACLTGFQGFLKAPTDADDPMSYMHERIWGDEEFRFVGAATIGPYFVRREAFMALGGWDMEFSGVGEPGIGYEHEFAFRCWLNGWEVGAMFTPLKGHACVYEKSGGTFMYGLDLRNERNKKNHTRVASLYAPHARTINDAVARANRRIGLA